MWLIIWQHCFIYFGNVSVVLMIVIDVCESAGSSVHRLIERFGLPQTGSETRFYMNHVLSYDQTRRTPRWVQEHLSSHRLLGQFDLMTSASDAGDPSCLSHLILSKTHKLYMLVTSTVKVNRRLNMLPLLIKETVHPKMTFVIIYSLSCRLKPVIISILCWTQKRLFWRMWLIKQ